jgi:hypothetical protein
MTLNDRGEEFTSYIEEPLLNLLSPRTNYNSLLYSFLFHVHPGLSLKSHSVTVKEFQQTLIKGRINNRVRAGTELHKSKGIVQHKKARGILCLRSEDAFVITCVANLMEVKVLYVQQDLWYEMYSYWRFNV